MQSAKRSKLILSIAYIYLLLPFLIFAIGWMRLYYAVPIVVCVSFCFVKVLKESSALWIPEINRENIVKILFIIAVISIWVYYSGIGKFVFQNTDHAYRNGIFNMLVEKNWPVINENVIQSKMPGVSRTGLIYYIGFWLPSAIIGKLFGLRCGYYAQAVWALLGICLAYYLLCARVKKLEVWPLSIFILFSGLDIVGQYLIGTNLFTLDNTLHLEWWSTAYQYSGMTTQLFWVFNQAVPIWLCTMVILLQKNNRNMVFLLACSLITSTLPFIGLFAIVVFLCFMRKYPNQEKHPFKKNGYFYNLIKDTCTFQNVLGGGIIGIFSALYLGTNFSGGIVNEVAVLPIDKQNSLSKYVIFLIIEVGIYIIIIYKYHQTNKLYYFVCLMLAVIPPIHVGTGNDFCMRVSIPFLFILMILVMDTLRSSYSAKDTVAFRALVIVLVIGSMTSLFEFTRTIARTNERINAGEIVYEEDKEFEIILSGKNFCGDIENNIFFEYIVK